MKDVLVTSLAEQQCKIVRAPVGSGSFFYALQQGGATDLSMQELRRTSGGTSCFLSFQASSLKSHTASISFAGTSGENLNINIYMATPSYIYIFIYISLSLSLSLSHCLGSLSLWLRSSATRHCQGGLHMLKFRALSAHLRFCRPWCLFLGRSFPPSEVTHQWFWFCTSPCPWQSDSQPISRLVIPWTSARETKKQVPWNLALLQDFRRVPRHLS